MSALRRRPERRRSAEEVRLPGLQAQTKQRDVVTQTGGSALSRSVDDALEEALERKAG